jgi:hypothetical protein
MTSVVDLWRAIDPDARLVSGSPDRLGSVVRGLMRARVAPPHLPPSVEAGVLLADASLALPLDEFLAGLRQADLRPVALVVGATDRRPIEAVSDPMPVLASDSPAAELADAATSYLGDEAAWLSRLAAELRLLCAEATLAEPEIGTPSGLVAGRIRRGLAVSVDGDLRALHARPAGRALAARFAATHARLLASGGERRPALRARRDGLWLLERSVRPGASVWLFDDLPLAAVDEVAADAAALTLRALLRGPGRARRSISPGPAPQAAAPPAGPFADTLLAVAMHNGRVAPAARALGVHRNTVLYRLRRAHADTGLDPRRPEDALRILRGRQR